MQWNCDILCRSVRLAICSISIEFNLGSLTVSCAHNIIKGLTIHILSYLLITCYMGGIKMLSATNYICEIMCSPLFCLILDLNILAIAIDTTTNRANTVTESTDTNPETTGKK